MNPVRSKVIWVLAALGAAVAGFWLARELHSPTPQLASGTWLTEPRELTDFSLTDQTGQPLKLESLRGRPTLVFFGFTHCPDVCPTTLATLAQVRKTAGIEGLRVLLATVDPVRDSPAVLGKYLEAFDPKFVGATGSEAAMNALGKQFSVAVRRVELPGGDYTMDHSAAVFLLDDRAEMVAVFTPPFEAAGLAADLRSAAPHLKSR